MKKQAGTAWLPYGLQKRVARPYRLQNLMHTQGRTFATVLYNLLAKEGNNYYPYCIIAEIYSPEFLTLAEVNQIYPEPIPEKVNPQNTFNAIDIIDHMKL